MSNERALVLGSSSTQYQNNSFPKRPKRNFESLLQLSKQEAFGYPSPPMSSPPSPGPPLELTSSEPTTSMISTSATTLSLSGPAALPRVQFAHPLPPPPPAQAPYFPSFQIQAPGPALPPASRPDFFQSGGVVTTNTGPVLGSSGATSIAFTPEGPPVRSGRKARGHVASACVNCKKAHLSCDINRPCSRCVASGKQDTCIDVQHKKRGRPRLREEGEFKVEQMMAEPAAPLPPGISSSPTSARSIARPRHSRAGSLRSLRSQTSDSSGPSALPTPTFPQPPSAPPMFGLQPPTFPSAALGAAEIPTACLDLDLIFIRANDRFQQAMSGGQDVRGGRLDDVATAADSVDFQTIRNQLREEREAREPSYMPPILQHSQDPLQGISDTDIEQLTQGFTDRTFIWTPNQLSASRERYTVRVRLAKASAYFVVVTLPPIRQTMPPLSGPPSSPFAVPSAERYQLFETSPTHSLPRVYGMQPISGAPRLQQQPPPSFSHSPYQQPPQTSQTPQQLPPPVTPRLAATQPMTETIPFTPPTGTRDIVQPPQESLQLAPMVGAPAAAAGPSTSEPPQSQPRRPSSEDEDDEEQSPKKRRRVGIDDVLQR